MKLGDEDATSLAKWNALMRAGTEGMRTVGLPGVAVNRVYRMFVNQAGEIQPWALVGGEPEERNNGDQ